MYNGIINIYKEKGFTSFDVIAKLRGILKQKKIGHTGTLDPDATGVLPVCLGNGTKLCELLTEKQKEYVACMRLGMKTDTQDISGTVLEESKVECSEEEIVEAVTSFLGTQEQIPPMYSAIKINGKKLYELARKGITVERASRSITIYEIEIIEINIPEVKIRVVCSKGTYIRTLCEDIGNKLRCGAVMTSLVRTRVSEFRIEDALSLDEVESLRDQKKLDEKIINVDDLFPGYHKIITNLESDRFLLNGNKLRFDQVSKYNEKKVSDLLCETDYKEMIGAKANVYLSSGEFAGIYKNDENGYFVPYKMFLLKE